MLFLQCVVCQQSTIVTPWLLYAHSALTSQVPKLDHSALTCTSLCDVGREMFRGTQTQYIVTLPCPCVRVESGRRRIAPSSLVRQERARPRPTRMCSHACTPFGRPRDRRRLSANPFGPTGMCRRLAAAKSRRWPQPSTRIGCANVRCRVLAASCRVAGHCDLSSAAAAHVVARCARAVVT